MDNDEVDLWATDEVHFQHHGSRCRMWIPPETKDPVLLQHPTRRSVGYFGAVRLRDGKLVYRRETGSFNAQTCFELLRQLRVARGVTEHRRRWSGTSEGLGRRYLAQKRGNHVCEQMKARPQLCR